MTLRNAAGQVLSKTALLASTTPVPETDPKVTIGANVYETYPLSGEGTHEMGRRLKYRAGQRVSTKDIDALYPTATVTSITPNTGPAVGGTAITITGTDLSGVTGVTIGGAAATNVQVRSATRVTATTPAGTAGARDVVVADDAGNVTVTGGFTYTA